MRRRRDQQTQRRGARVSGEFVLFLFGTIQKRENLVSPFHKGKRKYSFPKKKTSFI